MEYQLPDWSDVVLKRTAFDRLLDAIAARNYPALYAGLRKNDRKFDYDEAYRLCSAAIAGGCTVRAMETILSHCGPAVEDFADFRSECILPGYEGRLGGLVQEAAMHGQSHLLKFLLDRGCSPNARGAGVCSALEAALYHGAIGCVIVLEARDDVDLTVTETLRRLWAGMGTDPKRDACMRIIAGRLLGEGKGVFHPEIPLLPGMTVRHAAEQENWPLVCRMCREGAAVTEQQGKDVLERYMFLQPVLDPAECGELLEALFTACPGLLRCEYPRYVLTLCMLTGEEQTAARLRPWVERMPGRSVVLCGRRLADPHYEICEGLLQWERRMGSRLQPVLRRDKLMPVRALAQVRDRELSFLLERCEIRGTAKAGQVSRLAMDILQIASPGLLARLWEETEAFAGEDLDALLRYCTENLHVQQTEKRNILLAYGKKQVDYEL